VPAYQRSTLGTRLRGLRLAKGLSQVDLARLVGRHQTVIGPYERDEYEPPRTVVEKLARVLDTSPEYLYFGRSPQRSALPVAGRVGMLGLLEAQADDAEELLVLRDDQLIAFRIGDDSMAPVFRPGQIALVGVLEVAAAE
jgi:transcriptional regulator with XRE-family HTH domain